MIKVYGAKAFTDKLKGNIRDLRVTWVLEELGEPYEHIQLDPMKRENKTAEYLKLNPFGKVPTLQDGGFTLFESGAICTYLAERSGKLIPRDLQAKSVCLQWSFCALTNVEAQAGRVFGADFFMEPGQTTLDIKKMAQSGLARFLGPLDQLFSTQDFICHGEFTIADVFMTTSLNMAAHDALFEKYPNVRRYLDRMRSRPAYQAAFQKNG